MTFGVDKTASASDCQTCSCSIRVTIRPHEDVTMLKKCRIMLAGGALLLALFLTASPLQGARKGALDLARARLASSSELPGYASPSSHSRERAAKQTAPSTAAIESSYYYQGRLIRLQRSSDKLSVRFRAGVSKTSRTKLVHRLSSSAGLQQASRLRGRDLSSVDLEKASKKGVTRLLADLRANKNVEFAYPAWVNPKSGGRVLLTDEVIVRLKGGSATAQVKAALAARNLAVARKISYSSDEYVLKLLAPKQADPLAVSRSLYRSGLVRWAVPNFVQELQRYYTPNDPLFPDQWHLNNTGQSGGTVGADAKLTSAWNTQRGNAGTTIAIIDDGVQLTHPDLSANIYTNPGETAGNGVDDDGNGYIDDVHGWNFVSNSNDPNPDSLSDAHGTSVAGVAAARGNNAVGVSGACPSCTILPVKIVSEDTWAADDAIADAIRYASRLADVLSTHPFRWTYSKDSSDSDGDDTMWLAWVTFPGDSSPTTFESGLPSGWTTGGDALWSVVTDPVHTDEGLALSRSAKAGTIGDSQSTWLEVTKTISAGDLTFYDWISSEYYYDGLTFSIDGSDLVTPADGYSGVPYVATGVSYPAAYPEAIAIGASSDYDSRADYSQYGPELDLVAPSSGGPLNGSITTTDRTGADGYESGDYTSGFGGTSSATPLASGVAGLILSRNPGLTMTQVRQLMFDSADKVSPGLAAYNGSGFSNRYGYGRIDAAGALGSTALPATLNLSASSYSVAETGKTVSVGVRRGGNTAIAASVHFATTGGTATASSDYTTVSQNVSFAAGETSKTVSVPITDDTLVEGSETVSLVLSYPSAGATLGSPSTATLTITDNDTAPPVAVKGRIASAKLSKKVFKRAQARKVKLTVKFSPPSKKFNYVLSFRKNGKWRKVKTVKRTGNFAGTRKMTVKSLFKGKAVKKGRYRIKLTADANSRTLGFRVK
jgi:subtilisin family serine protease